MTEMRKDRRTPASLKVKYKSATVDDFIEQFGTDLSRGGIFIKTKKPLDTGALLKFEFQLQDGSALIHGVGRVAWRRLEQAARPDLPAGMGIKFFKLSDNSRQLVDRIESRYARENSRYEQTEAAEFAPPLSAPPAGETSASGQPSNGRPGSGSGPLTMPPPPATSSLPPALADVPASGSAVRTAPPASMPSRAAMPSGSAPMGRPAAAIGGKLAGPSSSAGFVAGAFQSASAARVQPERVRRDPQSVELARELFGDLAGEPAANTGASARPSMSGTQTAASMGAELGEPVDESVSNAVTAPPPASFNPPPLELPRPAASTRPPQKKRAESVEAKVVEAAPVEATSVSADAPAAPPASVRPRAASGRPSARVSRPHATAPSADSPLKLAVKSTPPARAAAPVAKSGRSKVLVLVAFGSTVLLAGAAAFVLMQRNRAATELASAPPPAAKPVPPVAAKPEPAAEPPNAPEPVAAAAEPAAAEPAAAEPAAEEPAAEPTPGPPVTFQVTSVPRGAEVWLADKRAGVTPLRLTLPADVPADLELRNRGFESAHRSVTPLAGMPPEAFELRALRYELTVETTPPGATVTASKQTAVSPAPLDLGTPRGPVVLVAQLAGHQSAQRVIRLAEFQERGGVMRAHAAITLTAVPAGRRPAEPAEPPAAAPEPPAPPSSAALEAPPEPPPPVMQVKPVAESQAETKAPAAEPPQAKAAPETPAPSQPSAPGN